MGEKFNKVSDASGEFWECAKCGFRMPYSKENLAKMRTHYAESHQAEEHNDIPELNVDKEVNSMDDKENVVQEEELESIENEEPVQNEQQLSEIKYEDRRQRRGSASETEYRTGEEGEEHKVPQDIELVMEKGEDGLDEIKIRYLVEALNILKVRTAPWIMKTIKLNPMIIRELPRLFSLLVQSDVKPAYAQVICDNIKSIDGKYRHLIKTYDSVYPTDSLTGYTPTGYDQPQRPFERPRYYEPPTIDRRLDFDTRNPYDYDRRDSIFGSVPNVFDRDNREYVSRERDIVEQIRAEQNQATNAIVTAMTEMMRMMQQQQMENMKMILDMINRSNQNNQSNKNDQMFEMFKEFLNRFTDMNKRDDPTVELLKRQLDELRKSNETLREEMKRRELEEVKSQINALAGMLESVRSSGQQELAEMLNEKIEELRGYVAARTARALEQGQLPAEATVAIKEIEESAQTTRATMDKLAQLAETYMRVNLGVNPPPKNMTPKKELSEEELERLKREYGLNDQSYSVNVNPSNNPVQTHNIVNADNEVVVEMGGDGNTSNDIIKHYEGEGDKREHKTGKRKSKKNEQISDSDVSTDANDDETDLNTTLEGDEDVTMSIDTELKPIDTNAPIELGEQESEKRDDSDNKREVDKKGKH